MLYIGQPAARGQLIAGIVLGPSVWRQAQELLFRPSPEQKAMVG
jgi:hypothetical protein